ncbi:thioredoxin family protein [Pedobacter sp.]|uniref:thioredoxin family protein n=1 Tax=Pedobacter sp. TaxID=1411316 RepID=UPI00396CAE86
MKAKSLFLSIVILCVYSFTAMAQTKLTADDILNNAIKEAKATHKKVFIKFSASWCGWCHKMDDSMKDPAIKAYFDNNFVMRQLIVMENKDKKDLETPGAEEMMKKYNSEGFGIPLWFIFDENGKLLADSHIRPKGTGFETKGTSIIGCPASESEVALFIDILRSTTKLKEAELRKIYWVFRKNDPQYKG